ncbi:MAG: hypothetical protein OEM85_02895 [Gammaproteobacteria bacterium]|nr:hypothetical protein [Gammaproteobacteria bacterium]MDH3409705.1 hypothetical protein [Gammaproteobacteria bacterium]
MRQGRSAISVHSSIKPLLLVIFAVLATSACKEQASVSTSGGIPAPPSGGMPAPPGGPPAPPAPPGGSSGGSSSPSGGMPPPPPPGGGADGGMPQGSEGPSGSSSGSSGSEGSSGEVGRFPGGGEESAGVPPPPSSSGGAAGEDGAESGDAGGESGDSAEPSDWEDESAGESECGDTGSLPGGVGGMGQDGECIGGGAASASEESSESAAGGSGGGGAEGSMQGTGGAGRVGEFPDESAAERAARLGRELEKSIGGFDEVLQDEQREVASVGRSTEGFGGGVPGDSDGDGGISLGEQGSNSGNPVSVANSSISRESPIDAMSEQEIRERTPEDIPIMVDDDIIARQLREAALAENDPALRERLWEEYRKYSGR